MGNTARQEYRGARFEAMLQRPGSREFRPVLKYLALKRYKNYRALAEKLCVHPDPETLELLVEKRTRQVETLLNDPEDCDPRSSFLAAVCELVLPPDTHFTATELGWDPSKQ